MYRKTGSTVLVLVFIVLCSISAAVALPAYMDLDSGIIIGRGEAVIAPGASYEDARMIAVDRAKTSIEKVIERQPMDLQSLETKTIGDYLETYPGRRIVIQSFLDSAIAFKEKIEGENIEITLILPIEGPDGYKAMVNRLTGDTLSEIRKSGPGNIGVMDEEDLREELKKSIGPRDPDDVVRTYKIAIIEFSNSSEFQDLNLGAIASERLEDRFGRDSRFEIISGLSAINLIESSGIQFEDIEKADVNTRVKIDGIDGLIIGEITKYQYKTEKHGIGGTGYLEMDFMVEADLKILDAETGRWLYFNMIPVEVNDRTFTLKSADDAERLISMKNLDNPEGLAYKAFDELIAKMEEMIRVSFPIEGYVLKAVGNKIYISFTRADGIEEGSVLTVYRLGDVLVDPITGENIDRIRDRIGTIKVVEAKDTYSHCITTEIPVEPIKSGDIVVIK
ncbi:MAG TPA: hypothetical protein PLN69_04030 [bacterium]|nr:hypothetical protein [bacterium]